MQCASRDPEHIFAIKSNQIQFLEKKKSINFFFLLNRGLTTFTQGCMLVSRLLPDVSTLLTNSLFGGDTSVSCRQLLWDSMG